LSTFFFHQQMFSRFFHIRLPCLQSSSQIVNKPNFMKTVKKSS
jgi:hypothetical protein